MDGELNFDVAAVVVNEPCPAGRVSRWRIAPFAAIKNGRCGGCAELLNQLASGTIFLDVEFEDRGHCVEAHRQTEISRPDHGAPPLRRVKKPIT